MKKKYNIRNLRKLNSLKPRHFAYDEDSGGDTLEDKLDTINEYLFGGLEVFSLDEEGADEAVAFFVERAENTDGEQQEVWKHLAQVISYLNGETNKKPQSLAVAHPCEKLQEYRYDYSKNIKTWLESSIEDLFISCIKPDGRLNEFLTMSIDDLEDYFSPDYEDRCREWIKYEERSGITNVLSYLAGNSDEIEKCHMKRDTDPDEADACIRIKYVKKYIGDILEDVVEKMDEDEGDVDGLNDTIRKHGVDYALWYAAENGDYDEVAKLLDMDDVDVNSSPEDGNTALMRAVYNEHEDIVELLLGCKDIEIDLDDDHGFTALMIAICNGDIDMMKILLEAGADPMAGGNGKNAVSIAKKHKNKKILELLKKYTD